jgi:protein-tyrosine-phosphatase
VEEESVATAGSALPEEKPLAARLVGKSSERKRAMYEHPSIQLELAKQRQADLVAEADRDRLASKVERGPSETVTLLKSLADGLKSVLTRRRPVVTRPELQPTS